MVTFCSPTKGIDRIQKNIIDRETRIFEMEKQKKDEMDKEVQSYPFRPKINVCISFRKSSI